MKNSSQEVSHVAILNPKTDAPHAITSVSVSDAITLLDEAIAGMDTPGSLYEFRTAQDHLRGLSAEIESYCRSLKNGKDSD